jgi:RNA polymerase subunit RPABC4/transcription elongation factor Spt4
MTDTDYPICPVCGGYIPNNERPGAYPGAISRRDNKTEICSECGTREALEDFFGSMSK